MKKNFLKHSRSGFTLVELIIGMTIFAVMSTMTILIYFNISESSRRLQISREISETTRQITEKINQEVQENKIFLDENFLQNYKNSGFNENEILLIWREKIEKFFIYWKKDNSNSNISPCQDEDKKNPETNCGLFLATEKPKSDPNEATDYNYFNLVDSFRENENEKRVKINDLKFEISGWENDVKKVALKMTVSLTKKSWIPNSLINGSKMEIQTTISERFYK